jgi:signal transduction histidine kinase
MMAAMTASIAHEIKQPLGAIVANANAGLRWLSRATPGLAEALECFGDIAADGHRANEVILSIRNMFVGGEQPGEPLDANALIRETVAILRNELEAAGITAELDLAPQLPLVPAHKGRVQQVMLNLLTNAADAMRSVVDRRRVITVTSKAAAPDGIAVSVRDCGPGIATQDAARIFDAFYTTKQHGMGMGLSICKSIVEAYGGRLSVASQEPHGATFRFNLPGAADEQ